LALFLCSEFLEEGKGASSPLAQALDKMDRILLGVVERRVIDLSQHLVRDKGMV
jgi:hypothetical protein